MKLISLTMIAGITVALSACGSNPPQTNNAAKPVSPNKPAKPMKRPLPVAPGTIKGMVMDKSNRPIANIQVELIPKQCFQPTQALVRSDGQGRYRFTNVPAGAYVLGLNGFSSAAATSKNVRYHATCSDQNTVNLLPNNRHGAVRHLELQPKPVR